MDLPSGVSLSKTWRVENFISWALDDARTVEERYLVELLVEQGVGRWNSHHKNYKYDTLDVIMERKRQRAFNPAYEPSYSEDSLRKSVEVFPEFTSWNFHCSLDERPLRDIKALRFLPNLETLQLHSTQVADLSPLTELPNLRVLHLGSRTCEDFRPLSRCLQLRELTLVFWRAYLLPDSSWPDLTGLDTLVQLESLSLEGNLLAFERGVRWPNVRRAELRCQPLAVRNMRDLPQLPSCEFLTLGGVERLDGIEAFPRLRNLTIETVVRDFAPLQALHGLTCFTCKEFEPLDVSPLTGLPKLQSITFDTRYKTRMLAVKPRDFSPLADAPLLRELHVHGSSPVESEVAAINATLLPWDDVLLAAHPRPLPPLRMIIAPNQKHPPIPELRAGPEDSGLPDEGLRQCEGRWASQLLTRAINSRLGQADWGNTSVCGRSRHCFVTIESFAVVEKLPQIVDALRETLARLRHDYDARIMIALKAPHIEPTPAQKELETKFRDEQDEADYERRRRDREEYLERLHRLELKKQAGEKIDPKDFVPSAQTPLPPPPWERDEEDDDDDTGSGSGDVAVKEKPDPPPSWDDEEHPLAHNYRLMGYLSLSEVWFCPHSRDLAIYLMGRQPDHEIPEEPA